jgi:HK97 gp10 family phage protein
MTLEINLTLEGAENLQHALQSLDNTLQQNIQQQLERWAMEAREYARTLAPVRTGRLRSGVYAKTSGWEAQIGAEASYAIFVEFGTRHMQAQPFLRPAVEEYMPRLEEMLVEALDQAVVEAGLT